MTLTLAYMWTLNFVICIPERLYQIATGERKLMNSELWHACAGPLVSLPPVGSLVVYFPQGHSEQVCIFWSWIGLLHRPDTVQLWSLKSVPTLCRWLHQCKRRQMEFQVILIFLPSWSACYTMLLYMYGSSSIHILAGSSRLHELFFHFHIFCLK